METPQQAPPNDTQKLTPLLEQYFFIKNQHQDSLLLFQVGDFYELFFDDAKIASQELSITLTKRGKCNGEDIPICGVPVSSINYHLAKLVNKGFKVAVCDQTSKPIPGEIVNREVKRVLTPGTLTDDLMMNQKKPSFLCSFWPFSNQWGLLFAEIMGGKLFATTINADKDKLLETELFRFLPDEILLPELKESLKFKDLLTRKGFCVNLAKSLENEPDNIQNFSLSNNLNLQSKVNELLKNNIDISELFTEGIEQGFGLLFCYLYKYHSGFLNTLTKIDKYKAKDFLQLDAATYKNLEIFRNNNDGSIKGSLISIIDKCCTGMGSRALKKALAFPLQNTEEINNRLDFVNFLKNSFWDFSFLQDLLIQFCDLERIVARLALGKTSIQDFLQLRSSLAVAQKLKIFLQKIKISLPLVKEFLFWIDDFEDLQFYLNSSLNDQGFEPKIKPGFSPRLDQARDFVKNSSNAILELEKKEAEQTQIPGFRIKYLDAHGYFFEINPNHAGKIPKEYNLLQTLIGKNRYTSPELKNLQDKIFTAQTEIEKIEDDVFLEITSTIYDHIGSLRRLAQIVATIDMLTSFAKTAIEQNYTRPKFIEEPKLKITAGRHPVVEQFIQNFFVSNDLLFDQKNNLIILTGPNMGGKSTFLRQTAHIVLLAHIGSFVPAENCELSICDKIFTRIGSADNLAAGKSTFLVEMEEVAAICQDSTTNSLLILDEVGRGTSTFDGIAIAQSILEYLLEKKIYKILFATHYHELTSLSENNPTVKNFFLNSEERNDTILFLHKVLPGVAKSSFGVSIAKLAGLPKPIISRAQNLLKKLENKNIIKSIGLPMKNNQKHETDVNKIQLITQMLKKITKFNADEISFKQAHEILCDLQQESINIKIENLLP